MTVAHALLDRDVLPDWITRAGIRRLCASRLREQAAGGPTASALRRVRLIHRLRASPIAVTPDLANAQHYELPPAFFARVLGPQLKYSCAWWPAGVGTLEAAESAMLNLTLARADLAEGQRILELGCGWGAVTLAMAAAFPRSHIVAVSNSVSQRRAIEARARTRRLHNVEIVTADINTFDTRDRFDRVVSVEMLEHVRNYPALFGRLARWLAPGGRLFVHVFAHTRFAYPFEPQDGSDWMARHFFTGGMMPSADLFHQVQDAFTIDAQWWIDGTHYQRTAEAWLRNFDAHRPAIDAILAQAYGPTGVRRWRARWRAFFMACAEMFGYDHGREWGVAHYRFRREP